METVHNVLIVEDEPLISMMLEDVLDALGHNVVGVCDSVPDALKFLMGKTWFWRLLGRKPMTAEQQREWIEGMALAKLNEWAARFVASLGPDALAQALADAGVPQTR